jgi:hypothetical protein
MCDAVEHMRNNKNTTGIGIVEIKTLKRLGDNPLNRGVKITLLYVQ